MGEAAPAKGDLPHIAGKPDEFIGWGADSAATLRLFETADIKYNSVWIGKGVLMRSVHIDTGRFGRDRVQALPAEVKRLRFFLFLGLVRFFNICLRISISQRCFEKIGV